MYGDPPDEADFPVPTWTRDQLSHAETYPPNKSRSASPGNREKAVKENLLIGFDRDWWLPSFGGIKRPQSIYPGRGAKCMHRKPPQWPTFAERETIGITNNPV